LGASAYADDIAILAPTPHAMWANGNAQIAR